MKMKYLIFIVFIIGLVSAAPNPGNFKFRNLFVEAKRTGTDRKPSPHIIGGQEAQPHSIPYQAILMSYSGSAGWYCGGTLITKTAVLTTGVCSSGADQIDVILGAHEFLKPESSQVLVTASDIKIHERFKYDSTGSVNDISILTLPTPVQLNSAISVIPLPKNNDDLYVGSSGRVSGWGFTSASSGMSDVLRYIDVPIISNGDCLDNLIVLYNNICTSGDGSKSSCDGDSGDPLVVDGVLVGIVSFQTEGCPGGKPTAHTRVSSFLDWIQLNSK